MGVLLDSFISIGPSLYDSSIASSIAALRIFIPPIAVSHDSVILYYAVSITWITQVLVELLLYVEDF